MNHTLEIDSIRLSYGHRVILSDIYVQCSTGSVIGLFGRNGSGKSSLLQIAFGIHEVKDHSVRIDQKSIKPAFRCPDGVSYLPQFNFVPASITLKKILSFYDIPFEYLIQELPKYSTRQKCKMNELSGGERRLIETFLIIKKQGQFVFLDEPFTHLMPLHIELICKWINEEKRNKGFIISDHLYQSVLPICDKFYLLKDGKTHLCKDRQDLVRLGYLYEL